MDLKEWCPGCTKVVIPHPFPGMTYRGFQCQWCKGKTVDLEESIVTAHKDRIFFQSAHIRISRELREATRLLRLVVDDLEETLPYASTFFREKWELGQSMADANQFLKEERHGK